MIVTGWPNMPKGHERPFLLKKSERKSKIWVLVNSDLGTIMLKLVDVDVYGSFWFTIFYRASLHPFVFDMSLIYVHTCCCIIIIR